MLKCGKMHRVLLVLEEAAMVHGFDFGVSLCGEWSDYDHKPEKA